jgi:hypothetical protein
MKKTAVFLVLLALVVMVPFSSCKKDEEEKKNELKYDGRSFDLSAGELTYYGDYYGSGSQNWDVYLFSDPDEFPDQDNSIYFELFSSSSTELLSGTYTYNATSMMPNTFDDGDFDVEKGTYSDGGYITGGTVKVSKSGTNYEFTINCDTNTGKKITGYYKGPLIYEDHSGLKSGKHRQK